MRRSIIFLTAIVAACAFGSPRSSALAQQSLSPAQRILAGYLSFPSGALPAGLKPQAISPVPNSVAAAEASDPMEVQKILDRARLDGLEQEFLQRLAGSPHLVVDVTLFRDSAGADADVTDPGPATAVPVPSFGDVSAGYSLSAGSNGVTALSFASGRLEVEVTEVGPTGSTSQADILPLAQLMASQAAVPPAAPTPDELAVLQTQTAPESILHDAYSLLVQHLLQPLPPSQVLASAYRGASTALAGAGVTDIPAAPSITAGDLDTAWGQFLPAYQALEGRAPNSLSLANLAYAAATEMYSNLNCHTHFDSPPVYSSLIESLQATEAAGTGFDLWVSPDRSTVAIERVEQNSPADQAGLQPGDVIQSINHQSLAEAAPHLNDLLSGPAGSSITLTIQRGGVAQPFDVTVILQPLQPVTEWHRLLQGGIGYIELDGFDDGDVAFNDVSNALSDFQTAGNVSGWILDLRFNPGGDEQTLARIAGLFVPSGSLIVTATEQDRTIDVTHSAGTPLPDQKPLVLLIGQDTASSAEIFSRSLEDLGRVTLVGETTSGCVNGGHTYGLLDGSGVFVSTQDVRSGPNRAVVEKIGVTPDITASWTLSDLQQHNDPALQAAIAALTGTP